MQREINQEALLHRMTNRIRQSLELKEILEATVAEIRSFLATDRVMVYRFHADSSGEVIAESIDANRLPALLGLHFPADDIPVQAREMFLLARQRSVVHVATQQIGLSPLDCPETGIPLADEDIRYRPLDCCHAEYLTAMGVQSSLVVPILNYDISSGKPKRHLWGLLVSHHAEPRSILERELELVQLVVDQVSIAIAQSNLLNQARQKADREAKINRVATLLHAQPTIQLQAALEETMAILEGAGGRLYIAISDPHPEVEALSNVQVYTCGAQPWGLDTENAEDNGDRGVLAKSSITHHPSPITNIEQHPCWQEVRKRGIPLLAIADLYKEHQWQAIAAAFVSTQIRGLLIIPLEYRQQFLGYLSIFRNEIDTETLWAGRFDPDRRQLYPRKSFESWRELKKGQAHEWTSDEISLAQALGTQFAMAVQQHLLFQQVQRLNTNLELQVQKRTAQLQQSLEYARVVSQVIDQIRSTLDLKTILQTIVQEVRNLLHTDRVVIYQFVEASHGKVVVEALKGNWPSLLGLRLPKEYFPQEYVSLYKQGRIRAIDDTVRTNLTACHLEFLQSIQVRANLVVPIRSGEELWGLLIAHECHSPRIWQAAEIDLLQKLADQTAIAIKQAELYEQSLAAASQEQAKAQQLETALEKLQRTQAQLIQTEKMSGLGQLVAGIAHEINNPVNFIYGNLSHASQYTQDLLELLQLYQKCYPDPHPAIRDRAEAIELDFLTEDLVKLLASMQVGADRIRQLVLSLRNFSRLDESESKPVDIHEGLENTLLILQHRLKPKGPNLGIQIIKNYGNLSPVECYAGQLNQVFMNIVSNAIDALEGSSHSVESNGKEFTPLPTIRIRTEIVNNNRVRIRIADNGPGMPAHVQARIFDPFFTTKPVGKGTGLGLAISYQIVVEKHNGVLKCISQPGQGTEFLIEIPLETSDVKSLKIQN